MEETPKLLTRAQQADELPFALQKIWGPETKFEFKPDILKLYKKFKRSGIPQNYLDLSWGDFKNTDIEGFELAKDFARIIDYHWKSGGGIWIHGANGTGKSFLSYMIAKTAIVKKIPTVCFTLLEYFEAKRIGKIQPNLSMELTKDIEESNVVSIDDFGKEYGKGTDWASYESSTALHKVFKEGAMKAIIINTALPKDNFAEKAGFSIISRMSMFQNLGLTGEDFRNYTFSSKEFGAMRAKETSHEHCWKPHQLLTDNTIEKHVDNLCLVCKHRFHPHLCILEYNKRK